MDGPTSSESKEALGNKVLYIPARYGVDASVSMLQEYQGRDVKQEKATIQIFERAGYQIMRNLGYTGKQGELALKLSDVISHGRHRILNDEIAHKTGIPRPREFTVDEVRNSSFPVVAKNTLQHGGDGIYVLESEEAWKRYIARSMMTQKLSDLYFEPNYQDIIARVMVKIKNWDFNDEWFTNHDPKELEYYQFQELVQNPGDYYTSFRVIADAFGEVYSGTLIRSAYKKGEERLNKPNMQFSNDPIEEVSYSQTPYDLLLIHPDSPFFINSPKIVSNVAQGGIAISLNGEPVTDDTNRQVLIDHGIDPDKPITPSVLEQRASIVGKAARGMNAYVGVDFMMNRELNPLFLEANFGPVLTPEEIGIANPQNYISGSVVETSKYCQLALLSKIANKL